MIPRLCPFELEIKMAEEDETSKQHEKLTRYYFKLFVLMLSPQNRVLFILYIFCIMLHGICEKPSKLIQSYNKSLIARNRTWRISALGLFCTDLAALGPYCQVLLRSENIS